MSQPTTRLIRTVPGNSPDQPKPRPTRRVPVTRRILAELDRAGNLPLVAGWDPGPLVGLPVGRTYVELARVVYENPEPTVAQVKTVQRACKRLHADGLIELSRGSRGVVVRRVMTAADHEYRAEVERRVEEGRQARAEAEANTLDYPVDAGVGGIVNVPVEPVLIITREGGVELRGDAQDAEDTVLAGLAALRARRAR